ncbi:MAG: ribonuclease G [Pseudomonadota bacterium]
MTAVSEEILVNVTPSEQRAAVVENGVLHEVFIERASRRGLVGNIYKGRVSRVLPGMQAAFIDIGLERTAFLHASDIAAPVDPADPDHGELRAPNGDGTPSIRDLVSEGGEILVQVLKDPLGTKGARLTTFITLPSRYLVMMPGSDNIGVSARIDDDDERTRLRDVLEDIVDAAAGNGYIVRTAAEGASYDALRADMMFLQRLWEGIRKQAGNTSAGRIVHEDLPLALRVLRDRVQDDVERIRVDSEAEFERMRAFTASFLPELTDKIELYGGRRPIFDLHGVEEDIARALERKVPLKSGGYLIFDQTEAMTTVDVNTGGFVGTRSQEDTLYRTNLEAAVAIARQLRLRNLGGIIILDFIDMLEPSHREKVLQALETALSTDNAKYQVMPVSPLGLVEMTRKRTRESLEHVLCEACPTCAGRGSVKTAQTVVYEIFREILRQHRQFSFDELLILAQGDVVELLLDEESVGLAELSDATGAAVRLQAEQLYAPDQYDVVLL